MITRAIPCSSELLPVIGLGTWQTFDVASNQERKNLTAVLTQLNEAGGKLIDTSPMYGKAEQAIGDITGSMITGNEFFYATKVWTRGQREGIRQMQQSMLKMKRTKLDLIQVHNLTDWQTHLPTLRKWKEQGLLKYMGITHYADSSHEELERIIRSEKIDFVQFNYSIDARHAEQRLLQAAADEGVATIINRPFGEGRLFRKVNGKLLPAWVKELEINSWAAFFLKFIIAHHAVTCVIPATGNIEHARENLYAVKGKLPDMQTRDKMAKFIDTL